MKKLNKESYNKLKKENTNPILLCHAIYMHCYGDQAKAKDMNLFQITFNMWLMTKGSNLMQGSLVIKDKFDKEFV